MSSLVASWGSIIGKIGIGDSYNSFYCPSMSQILSYSSKIAICGSNDISFVKGYYSNNQLVELSDISYKSPGGGGGEIIIPTPKTYTITGVINLTGSGNWVLQDSDGGGIVMGHISGPGEFEITCPCFTKPYYLEITILNTADNLYYVNGNHNSVLTFNSNNLCSLGTLSWILPYQPQPPLVGPIA